MSYKEEQVAFLENNKKQSGVQTTKSGLQYRVISEGTGKSPTVHNEVEVDYKGSFIDGKEFDSSYRRGESITFPLRNVIRGWQEGIPLMKEGAKFEFFIPSEIAYGENDYHTIPGGSTLIFEVELHKVI